MPRQNELGVVAKINNLAHFVQDGKKVEATLDGIKDSAKKTRGASRSVGFQGRNATFALQQLAFGAEDFTSVIGTQGLAGGLRAAGNNISQFASLLHPAIGALAGFGVAGAAIALQFSGNKENGLDQAAKAADRANESFKLLVDNAKAAVKELLNLDEAGVEDIGNGLQAIDDFRRQTNKAVNEDEQRARDAADRLALAEKRVSDSRVVLNSPFSNQSTAVKELAEAKQELENAREAQRKADIQLFQRQETAAKVRTELNKLEEEIVKKDKASKESLDKSLESRRLSTEDRKDPTASLRREFNETVRIAKKVLSDSDFLLFFDEIQKTFSDDIDSRIKEEKKARRITDLPSGSSLNSGTTAIDRLFRASLGRNRIDESAKQQKITNDLLRKLRTDVNGLDKNNDTAIGIGI